MCNKRQGHYLTSWEAACRMVDRIYQVDVPEKADVIVASCGGFPKDISLYQGTKTIDNIESGLKPGGTLILIIEAREGGGPAEYFDWAKDLVAGTIERRLREHFTVAGYIFFLNCEQAQRYNILLYSSIAPEAVSYTHLADAVPMEKMESISGYLDDWENVSFEDKRQVVDALITVIRATNEKVEIEWKI